MSEKPDNDSEEFSEDMRDVTRIKHITSWSGTRHSVSTQLEKGALPTVEKKPTMQNQIPSDTESRRSFYGGGEMARFPSKDELDLAVPLT
jgi:hypothetical protein